LSARKSPKRISKHDQKAQNLKVEREKEGPEEKRTSNSTKKRAKNPETCEITKRAKKAAAKQGKEARENLKDATKTHQTPKAREKGRQERVFMAKKEGKQDLLKGSPRGKNEQNASEIIG
jgi:hypothetical protein